jgi:hypothetical protein
MIGEFKFYHGVVLRTLICELRGARIVPFDFAGRLDSFKIGENCAIHIKHSTSRLPPWTFTVTSDNLKEIIEMRRRVPHVFFVLVCGEDGLVAISMAEFVTISESRPGGAVPLRVSRNRNEMYTVNGNTGALTRKKPRGLGEILTTCQATN